MNMTIFNNLTDTAKIMLKWVIRLCGAVAGIGIVILIIINMKNLIIPYICGLLLGTLLSIVKLVLLDKSINNSGSMDKKTVNGYVAIQYFIRYLLTVAVLLTGFFLSKYVNLFGVIAGTFLLQFSAYFASFEEKKNAGKLAKEKKEESI